MLYSNIIKLVILLVTVPIIILGCTSNDIDGNRSYIAEEVIENIKIDIINESFLPEGISFSLKLRNESNEVIVQNNVYVSFPITNKDKTKSIMNKCKVEATGNKINIEPGEEVVLNVFIQKENFFNNEYILSESPDLQIVGYIKELKNLNRFEINGSFEFFDKSYKLKMGKK